MTPTIGDIINAIECLAPPRLQESFDNTGLQCGDIATPCTGALLCVDLTPGIVDEAIRRDCNLIVTHHPLLFHAIKRVGGRGRVQQALVKAIKADIAVYSCHTAVDNAPGGISHAMAQRLGLTDIKVLDTHPDSDMGIVGCGVTGLLPSPLTHIQFVELVKSTFNSSIARCSDPTAEPQGLSPIRRVALCGGAGSFLIENAIEAAADAFVTSDCKFNTFLDYATDIFLVDIGHYESEECAKDIFYHAITKKFPNFAVKYSQTEQNPIKYL